MGCYWSKDNSDLKNKSSFVQITRAGLDEVILTTLQSLRVTKLFKIIEKDFFFLIF